MCVCLASGNMPSLAMSLNPKQREAVAHGDGALLILAGAGSGKTRVLVHRIARLVNEERAEPTEILAVTFTNKAAGELVDRCRQLIGDTASGLWAGTFHGIGARLLRRHADAIGLNPRFTIFDSTDQIRVIKEIVGESGLDATIVTPESVRNYIEWAKHEARTAAEELRQQSEPHRRRLAQLYDSYEKRLALLGAMDFGDLITRVVELFRRRPELLRRYQERFRYVLVDEYQDTNRAQYLMVSMLAEGHGNISVVGDDDQSIYGWRGASLRNIREFERDFPGARVVHLEQNYRSSSNIVAVASALIANNGTRVDKTLWTENPPGTPVSIISAADEQDEARCIVASIMQDADSLRDSAVFYRTNAQSRALEEELVKAGLPYVIVGAMKFYERKEVRDLVAYLRFVYNPSDEISLARIVNVPARGIGKSSWEKLKAAAAAVPDTVWTVLNEDARIQTLAAGPKKRLIAFRDAAASWLSRSGGRVTPLLEAIIADTAYLDYLARVDPEDAVGRVENVQELLTVSQDFDREFEAGLGNDIGGGEGALAAFLERLALASDVDQYDDKGDRVTLMTVHNSKGLEFARVYLAGMEEGIFPHTRSMGSDEAGLEEERRLCYVGVTRAREELTLLHAKKRHIYGTVQENLPSRFLEEMPDSALRRKPSPALAQRARRLPMRPSRWRPRSAVENTVTIQPSHHSGGDSVYRIGTRVVHPMFGRGTVSKTVGSGESEKLVVRFESVGLKKLVARYAKLEVV
ncbi:MAG: ATP-dependent helicase [Candidatus Binatia bacterium]